MAFISAGVCVLLAFGFVSATTATTTIASGNWSDPGTWDGAVPTNNASALVAPGYVVTVDVATATLALFECQGTVVFSGWSNSLKAAQVDVSGTVTHLEQSDVTGTGGVYGDWTPDNRILILCSNLTLSSGGKIDANHKGYIAPTPSGVAIAGRGPGGASVSDHGGGGSYGGLGTLTSSGVNFNRPAYGDIFAPVDPGSSGASAWNYQAAAKGGNGGGAILIEAEGQVAINGTISADGQAAGPGNYSSGAGSGGSILITCATFTGNGLAENRPCRQQCLVAPPGWNGAGY